MYFFRFFTAFYLFFISSIGHSAFRHLDIAVEGAVRDMPAAQHPMAKFLFPQHLRAAENMVRGHRKVDFGGATLADMMHVPHRRHFDHSMLVKCFQEGHPCLPQTYGGALGSWFFPGTDEFTASTISRDDQASRLNRTQADEEVKDQASRRLGAVVRIVLETLSAEVLLADDASFQDLTCRILEALGENPQKKVFDDISIEAFAHYEVLLGLQEAYDNLTGLVQSLSEGDASALDELPPEVKVLVEDMRAGRMTFESMVRTPYVFFMVQITSALNGWGRLWPQPNKNKSIWATRWRGKS